MQTRRKATASTDAQPAPQEDGLQQQQYSQQQEHSNSTTRQQPARRTEDGPEGQQPDTAGVSSVPAPAVSVSSFPPSALVVPALPPSLTFASGGGTGGVLAATPVTYGNSQPINANTIANLPPLASPAIHMPLSSPAYFGMNTPGQYYSAYNIMSTPQPYTAASYPQGPYSSNFNSYHPAMMNASPAMGIASAPTSAGGQRPDLADERRPWTKESAAHDT
jgi:hypothetical protein